MAHQCIYATVSRRTEHCVVLIKATVNTPIPLYTSESSNSNVISILTDHRHPSSVEQRNLYLVCGSSYHKKWVYLSEYIEDLRSMSSITASAVSRTIISVPNTGTWRISVPIRTLSLSRMIANQNQNAPNFLHHSWYVFHSNSVGISKTFPMIGQPFGPGGRGSEL